MFANGCAPFFFLAVIILHLLQSWVMKLERVVLKLDLRATIGESVVVGISNVLVLKIELRHVHSAF